jgi:hypothetical protein
LEAAWLRRRNGAAKWAGGSKQVDGSGWVWRETV